jgi:hypothetical protein
MSTWLVVASWWRCLLLPWWLRRCIALLLALLVASERWLIRSVRRWLRITPPAWWW